MNSHLKYRGAKDGTAVIADDPYLEPYADALRKRYKRFTDKLSEIEKYEGGILEFSKGYLKFGFNRVEGGIQYREWCPGAKQVNLIGDFNEWNRESHPLTGDQFGVWSIFLPDVDGKSAINHATRVKISIKSNSGENFDRIPAWDKVVWQEWGKIAFEGVYWDPPNKHQWKNKSPGTHTNLRIYEAHIGMSSQDPKISTYIEFGETVLPQIVELGYNAVQLMGVMEHAYYASFGYQVTNFFAVSSRFGTPEELKGLIDKAHGMGLVVFLDLVHSHASKNVDDGLNFFDGTDHCYFHGGGKGYHPVWDSRLFNYSHWEVLRFLLSNARWWLDEYHFDGFRFDGVSSMLYVHHGVLHGFDSGYDEYFKEEWVDSDAVLYLTLANHLIHLLDPNYVTIAEDVSGMACLCRPISEGGIGFNYRLAMGLPDKWIDLLKNKKDEDWGMGELVWTLTNRRYKEDNIAYAESHDQALVGDKTIAFWLMDKEMYTNMSKLEPESQITSRGMALHKLIRLITMALGGEGYLNFMGNEFGHPEWIDFPRQGNNDSYHYARRRWDLHRDPLLRYGQLRAFDKAIQHLEEKYKWLSSPQAYILMTHEDDKLIAFERGNLFWVFNFHSHKSFSDYRFGISRPGKYKIVLDSDNPEFGGYHRITKYDDYHTQQIGMHGKPQSLQVIYTPCRTALVFAPDD